MLVSNSYTYSLLCTIPGPENTYHGFVLNAGLSWFVLWTSQIYLTGVLKTKGMQHTPSKTFVFSTGIQYNVPKAAVSLNHFYSKTRLQLHSTIIYSCSIGPCWLSSLFLPLMQSQLHTHKLSLLKPVLHTSQLFKEAKQKINWYFQ